MGEWICLEKGAVFGVRQINYPICAGTVRPTTGAIRMTPNAR